MARATSNAIGRTIGVLIPVVVGSLLGLTASLATNYYTFRIGQKETIRRERAEHAERVMMLAAKFTNNVSKVIGFGLITKGKATSGDIPTLTAPTDSLMELTAAVALYFPELKNDVQQINVAYGAMMMRFDEITDSHDEHQKEDAVALRQRLEKEVAPVMERVGNLMKKLGDLARTSDA
jgi:hypothetical protein